MTQDEIIETARQVGIKYRGFGDEFYSPQSDGVEIEQMHAFAQLVADKKQAEMQAQIESLYAMYQQACEQRDALMDQQRSMIAAMRGKLQ